MSVHIPVLIDEVIRNLNVKENCNYLDGTFGGGGYAKAILSLGANVTAIDRDINVMSHVETVKNDFGNKFSFFNKKFSELKELLTSLNIKLDGAVFDLGVSSMQLDEPDRGFSFRYDAPLDMRMGLNNFSAYDVVNKIPREQLEKLLLDFGEEYKFKKITQEIINYRKNKPIETTKELANIVEKVYGKRDRIHPATKTFQAIRIFVNNELEEIKEMLNIVLSFLNIGARLLIVSFHSLEDRIVKHYFRNSDKLLYKVLTKKPIIANKIELDNNLRSRSAKLRVIERIG